MLIKAAVPRRPDAGVQTDGTAEEDGGESDGKGIGLPEHSIEWIDFGMMGTLSKKQRQSILDLVTNVLMKDAYGLKRAVLQVAQPKGEINHGNILEMCEEICGQFVGTDFGDFDLGDLIDSILAGLESENFKVDPFLTNLARGIIAVEGTVKALSPKVNILNYFTDKVETGFNFNLDLENPGEMNPEIALKLLQFFQGVTESAGKTAETLDMLEKGQLKVRTDFGFEEKALGAVSRLTGYAVRGLMVIGLFIGSCLLCFASAFTGEGAPVTTVFLVLGLVGYGLSVLLAISLFMRKDVTNNKKRKKKESRGAVPVTPISVRIFPAWRKRSGLIRPAS